MGRYDDANSKPPFIGIVIVIVLAAIIAVTAWLLFSDDGEEKSGDVVKKLSVPATKKTEDQADTEVENIEKIPIDQPTQQPEQPDETTESQESVEPVDELPPLENSDELVGQELTSLSPDLAEQFKSTELIRKFLQIANDFSQGQRLYKHMKYFQLQEPFAADLDSQGMFISQRSYQRYDKLAQAFAAIDPDKAIAVYRKIRPLMQQVYEEFGYPEEYKLEDILTKSAAEIIAAPVVDGRVALDRPTVRYKFADEKLEALSPVQKQMLRMGPANTRLIQEKLRQLVQKLVQLQGE